MMNMNSSKSECREIRSITFLSDLSELDEENDNVDVHLSWKTDTNLLSW